MVSKKVLVADDEAHILHVVTMKLKNAGYEVITFRTRGGALLCAGLLNAFDVLLGAMAR